MQRHGVGSGLLRALRERAIAAGIRRFTATMLPDNRGADALARALGRREVLGIGHGAVEIVIDLDLPGQT
jgi:L-amino acid N-acyltransferase YncA